MQRPILYTPTAAHSAIVQDEEVLLIGDDMGILYMYRYID